jgi:Holliday junction resolvase RusA-like endonuclease
MLGERTMKTEFFLPMKNIPTVTHQDKAVSLKNDEIVFYEPPELKAARVKLRDHLVGHIPVKKHTGPLRVIVKWCFLAKGKHREGEWKVTKPDTHNMNKLLFDIMTELGFWEDDRFVTSEIIEKFWSDIPGIYICIEELI